LWSCLQVVALDATEFETPTAQLTERSISRELTKAFLGFQGPSLGAGRQLCPGLATGSGGCGAFRGDRRLNALIQIMAAAEAGRRPITYYTSGDELISEHISNLLNIMSRSPHKPTVGDIWNCIMDFIGRLPRKRADIESITVELYQHIAQTCMQLTNNQLN
jgi:Poly (ADP-ribose) glycohydrolase (PARG)